MGKVIISQMSISGAQVNAQCYHKTDDLPSLIDYSLVAVKHITNCPFIFPFEKYIKICVKWPLKNRQNKGLNENW